jgi:hypothetical protein
MSHQQNHLAKRKKNIFDQAISNLISEIDVATNTLETTLKTLEDDGDVPALKLFLEHRLGQLWYMKQNRG